LNRPGGNVTGLTSMSLQLSGKRLEVLAEVVPGLSRVAVLWDPSALGKAAEWHQTLDAARYLQLEMISLEVRSPEEFDAAFAAAVSERADALIILGGPMFQSNHARLVELTTRHRLPAIYETPVLARRGGLVAYGPVTEDLFYRSANFVDRIL